MDPMTLALIGSLGAQVGSSVLGELFGSDEDLEAYNLRQEALADALGITVPELRELIPELQGRTNLAGVTTDPSFDAYEDEALARMAESGRAGGMDLRARAKLEQARMEAAAAERQSRESIRAGAMQRGTWGSGEELSSLMQAGQAAADRERMAGVQAAADAEERALSSIASMGRMAGERQGRQWGQRASVASAQDAIDNFNTRTSNDFALANEANRYRNFEGQMQATNLRNNARLGAANSAQARGDHQREVVGGIGQAVGYGLGAYGNHLAQQASPGAGAVLQGGRAVAPSATKRKVR